MKVYGRAAASSHHLILRKGPSPLSLQRLIQSVHLLESPRTLCWLFEWGERKEQISLKGSPWPVARLPITRPTASRDSASESALGGFSSVRTRVC